jgi:ribosomal-protein-alanine N-acetyltransferase
MDYVFETARMRVRAFVPDDVQHLFAIHSEAGVKQWIPNESYADPEETRQAVDFFAACVLKGRLPYVLAVELKETGELIGDIGINPVAGKDAEVEIGYAICKRHSGKGYATELVHAMIQYAASAFGIRVLFGRVMRGNHASVSVLKKNGFDFVSEEMGAEDDPYGNGMLIYKKEC